MKKKNKKTNSDKYVCFDKYIPLPDEEFSKLYHLYWDPTFREEEFAKIKIENEKEINMSIRPKNKEHLKMKPLPNTRSFEIDPASLKEFENFPPIATPEQEEALKNLDQFINASKAWIQTYTGKKFFPLSPREDGICIEDIAHSLAMQCRFTGHSKFHYSIAQHSVLVSYLCDSADKQHALLHDAAEAYVCDLASPLKRSGKFEDYKKIENELQKTIYRKFGLTEIEPVSVKSADLLMLCIEAQTLLSPIHPDWKFPVKPPSIMIMSLTPQEAEQTFLDRYKELFDVAQ